MKLNDLIAKSVPRIVAGLVLAFIATAASDAQSVYVVNGNSQFGVVNLSSGSFRAIGAPTPEPQEGLVWAPNGLLYTLGTVSGDLETVNPATGATAVVGPTGLPQFPTGISTAFSLASVNGKLYLTDFSNNLYSVNASTGAATMIGATGMPPDPRIPFTINPDGTLNLCDELMNGVGGKLYATFDSFTLDLTTGNVASVAVPPNLWQINPSTGVATLIGSTAFGLDGGFERNGQFYAFQTGNASQLMSLDLTNGNTVPLTNIDPAAGLIFGATPTPEPGTFLLLGSGLVGISGVIRRKRRKQ